MSIIDKFRLQSLVFLAAGFFIGCMGVYLNNLYGSSNPAALWNMLKSQEYRKAYMETKLECMEILPSTGLSKNTVDAVCFDMARIKAKAVYCEGKKLPICESIEK